MWPRRFRAGDRVRARQDALFGPGPWPAEPTGTIVGRRTTVRAAGRTNHLWWVEFDEAQDDLDGFGPYARAQVNERYLERLDE
jgi:hypothetical protein